MAARMVAVRTTDIWNIELTISRTGQLLSKEETTIDITVPPEDNRFLAETEDVSHTHAEMQRMIDSAFTVFQEVTLDPHIEAMVETTDFSLFQVANHEAAKNKKTPVHHAGENTVR